ncbi:MAG: hypothetical protein WAK48_01320 [Candidatus Acidiferrum sp.]
MDKKGLALAKSFTGRLLIFPETLFFKFIPFVLPKLLSRDYGSVIAGQPGEETGAGAKEIRPATAKF